VRRAVPAALSYPIDRYLADGALFLPSQMEHKWAIYFHRGKIIFIRSWLRKVVATATVQVVGDLASVLGIEGAFVDEGEPPQFTVRFADYLLRTHAARTMYPAPLPAGMEENGRTAALWCFSTFGNMVAYATAVEPPAAPPPEKPLRTHSLLHIAIARDDRAAARAQLDAGVPVDVLGNDGLAPLHWAVVGPDFGAAEFLLSHGSPVDARSAEGATPLMNAVQAKRPDSVDFLLDRGADVNAADARGFTALHRAAERGLVDVVRRLLERGASPDISAEGQTPLSLAQRHNEAEVVALLSR
jgi:hypothetical protein